MFFLCVLFLLLLASDNVLQDPDTYWHIATGQQIWVTGTVPWIDGFSHTFAGAPWIAKEWLSQLLLYGSHAFAGWRGVVALVSCVIAGSFTLLFLMLGQRLKHTVALMLAMVALFLSMPSLNARPQVFAVPLLILWIGTLVDAVERGRPPPWWLLAVAVAWANLHASFPVALLLAGCLGLEALVHAPSGARARTAGRWAGFGTACLAMMVATPYGVQSLLISLRVMGDNEARPFIHEWRAPDLDMLGGIALAIFALAMVVLLPQKRTMLRAAPVLLCGYLAFNHVRFLGMFAIVAGMALAGPLARRVPALGSHLIRASARARRAMRATIAGLVLACLGVLALNNPQPASTGSPIAALDAARRAGLSGPLYNSYNFGGFLIYNGVKTFVDGRSDQLFLGGFIRTLVGAATGSDDHSFMELLERYGVTWAMVSPASIPAGMLSRALGWREVYKDEVAAVYAKGG